MNEVKYAEYALDVYDKDCCFVRQIDVFDGYEKARDFMNSYDEELLDGEYLGIVAIFYDENDTEIGTKRL